MLKRLMLLALCLLLACGSAGAEGLVNPGGASPSPTGEAGTPLTEMGVDSGYLSWISQMAYLNGQPYGMTSFGGWRARTTIYAQTEQGMEVVWTGEGRGRGLFAVGDKLVLVAEEPTDFWEDVFSMYPPLGERFVEVIDPASWEAERLPIPPGEALVFEMDGEMVRWASWQEEEMLHAEIRRWNGAGWDAVFAWTGNALPEGWYGAAPYSGFVRLGQHVHGRGLRDLRIVTLADGREYLLTDVEPRYGNALNAVLDDGILYLMGDSGLWAFDLAAGTRELLLPGTVGTFIMNGRYIVFSHDADYDDNECRMQVYDRETATLLREVTVPNDANCWVLDGDTLYLQDYTKGGYWVNGVMTVERPYSAVIDLTTGECRTTPFDY